MNRLVYGGSFQDLKYYVRTYIIYHIWTYKGETLFEKSLVPYSMVKGMISLWSIKKCYYSYNIFLLQ